MLFSKAVALELCALNEAAYDLATTGHCKLPDGFAPPVPIRMPAAARPRFLARDPLDIWGYATNRDRKLYLVFRGTEVTSGIECMQEWALDAHALPAVRFEGMGSVHCGFHGAWMALRAAVFDISDTWGHIIVTGHSLGAAIATLCAVDLGGDLLTFGCPRVGDMAFGGCLWGDSVVRIINNHDIVPDVPLDPPFRHGGQEIRVAGPGSPFDRRLAHALPSYAAGLNLLP